jgi:hypothetical protein
MKITMSLHSNLAFRNLQCSEKLLFSSRCMRGFMPNLFKKSVMVSTKYDFHNTLSPLCLIYNPIVRKGEGWQSHLAAEICDLHCEQKCTVKLYYVSKYIETRYFKYKYIQVGNRRDQKFKNLENIFCNFASAWFDQRLSRREGM